MTKAKQAKFEIPEEFKPKVAKWKQDYGKVKYLDLDSKFEMKENGDKQVPEYTPGKAVFFRQPTRSEMSAAETLSVNESGQSDPYRKAERLMVDCYLGGQLTLDQILADIESYMAVANYVLYNLVEVKNVNWGSC